MTELLRIKKINPPSFISLKGLLVLVISLRCQDYGYECEYVTDGEIDKVVDEYKEHMNDVHGIEYSRESVLLFVKRKNM